MRGEGAPRRRFSIPARLLIALGALAQLAAALALISVDPLLEYAIPAPTVQRDKARIDAGIEALIEARDAVEAELDGAAEALSVGGVKGGASISGDGEARAATLTAVEARWLETCPRQVAEGRWMDGAELARGARVAALDEDLAFALFGSEGALGREIEIEGARYAVVGTLRHRRGPGESDAHSAYVPLRAAAAQGIQLDALILRALGAPDAGLAQSFAEVARAHWGPGEAHDSRRERMGALLASRLVICALGAALALRLGRRFAAWLRNRRARLARLRRRAYPRGWLGAALLDGFVALLGGALILASAWALLRAAVAPAYRFPEWVPESLVSLSALRELFWNRAMDAARTVSVNTAEAARIAFWGGTDRLGAELLLLGLALGRKKS